MRGCLLALAGLLFVALVAEALYDPYETGIAAFNEADYASAIRNLSRIGSSHRKRALARHVLYKAKLFEAQQLASRGRFDEALRFLWGFPEKHAFSGRARHIADALIAARGSSNRTPYQRADIKRGPGHQYETVGRLELGVEVLIGRSHDAWAPVLRLAPSLAGLDTIGFVTLSAFARSGSDPLADDERDPINSKGDAAGAVAGCKMYVRDALLSRKAKFSWSPKVAPVDGRYGVWVVGSYVDTENVFGVEIRLHWVCEVEFLAGVTIPRKNGIVFIR